LLFGVVLLPVPPFAVPAVASLPDALPVCARPRDGSVHVRLHARGGRRLRAGVLVDVVLGVLLLRAPLALRVAGGSVTAARPLLLGRLLQIGRASCRDRLRRLVLVLGLGVRGRAVALVHVAVRAVAEHADRGVHVRLPAGRGGGRPAGALVDVVSGFLLLPARLALVGLTGRVAAWRALLLGRLSLLRRLALVDRLGRVVLVLRFGVGRRAVALVDVPAVAADAHPLAVVARDRDRLVHVRLHARGRRGLGAGVLVDVVLGLLLLPAPLALRVAGGAVAAARPLLPGRLLLARALVLVGR